jgi:hypothetical protein
VEKNSRKTPRAKNLTEEEALKRNNEKHIDEKQMKLII